MSTLDGQSSDSTTRDGAPDVAQDGTLDVPFVADTGQDISAIAAGGTPGSGGATGSSGASGGGGATATGGTTNLGGAAGGGGTNTTRPGLTRLTPTSRAPKRWLGLSPKPSRTRVSAWLSI